MWFELLCLAGLLCALRVVYLVLSFIYKYFIRPAADLKRFLRNDAWAVVTGASDGIGKAFVLELAKRGFNVCLISRTKSKLDEVAAEVARKYKVKTEVIAADFSSKDLSFYDEIKRVVDKLDNVTLLVNNVGINYSYPVAFLDGSSELTDDLVHVNVNSLNKMTRIVLPKMVERKCGGIINLSSTSGVVPAPLLSVYSATKAYTVYFSWCLHAEYQKQGITVQVITPGMTVSNMSKIKKASALAFVATPEAIVKGSLNALGKEVCWCPYWAHALQEFAVQLLGTERAVSIIHNINTKTNKRARAKEEREAKTK